MAITSIEWADYTFNPWIGCAKVSPGCAHCYAERDFDHRRRVAKWGAVGTRHRTSPGNWKHPLRWNREAGQAREDWISRSTPHAPRSTIPTRPRVFCASLADIFEDRDELIPWRRDLFDLIGQTPNLDWLLLTKRPEQAAKWIPFYMDDDRYAGPGVEAIPNLWLGVSTENQATADERIPILLQIPAAVRFISAEPLLGPIDLRRFVWRAGLPVVDWVIAGGESGPHARPSHPDWFRSLRDQCAVAGVPFLFKQWGEWVPEDQGDTAPQGTEADFAMVDDQTGVGNLHPLFRAGKRYAGRELDGRTHDDFPRVSRSTGPQIGPQGGPHAPRSTDSP